jgi:hypothetical protein
MEGKTVESQFVPEEPDRPGCSVTCIANHGMAGKPGVPPDLMLAPGPQVAFDERVPVALAKDPIKGLARKSHSGAFRMNPASGFP